MPAPRVLIIEPNWLMRSAIEGVITRNCIEVAGAIECVSQFNSGQHESPSLALVGAQTSLQAEDAIRDLQATLPSIATAALVPSCTVDEAIDTLRTGARGILLQGMNPDSLIYAIRLMASGERFIPCIVAEALLCEAPSSQTGNHHTGKVIQLPLGSPALTPRERRLIRGISAGVTNKAIAEDLGLAESTVKVAITALLKKLGMRNRTQVASWAARGEPSARRAATV